ncbi:response regulator [Cohnella terricola]|uniref:Response regulator n=1 Tax=Cohnella terricola TaxID=1289167 RepID=A0A559J9T7_9BACL|nr:response regulator [Cohnella terricola]TVX96649.1 response regulator [Cohnella terricola]
MFSVMIVDDEPLFREYLQKKFDWNALDMAIVCEARNGIEALEQAEAFLPDIALVDINMPYMDGLALSEQLKLRYPDMSIVLVTGHNEFEYARRAIRIGVKDYLLKPFDKEEFSVTLNKVKSFMKAMHEEKANVQNQSALLRESFLLKLICPDFCMMREDAEAEMAQLRIPIPRRYCRVALTVIGHLRDNDEPTEASLWRNEVEKMLRELIPARGEPVLFHDAEGRIVSIIALDDREEALAYDGQAFEQLSRQVEHHFKITVTTGLGRLSNDPMELRLSYRDAVTAVQNRMTAGQGQVIWHERLGNNASAFELFSIELQEKLIYSLRMKERDTVEQLLDEVFSYLGQTRTAADTALTGLVGIVSIGLSFAAESGLAVGDLFGREFSPYRELERMQTIEQCREWLKALFCRLMNEVYGSRASKSLKLLEAAKQIIHDGYADSDLTVEAIAARLFIDGSYLRRIFKKEAGMPASDYLTFVRMQQAKKMLGEGKLKLSVVAELVGYNDANYFSKSFKKHFGFTPTEYELRKRR